MLVLKVEAPPFSINKAHYRNGNRTQACRKWGDDILEQLREYKADMDEFSTAYKERVHTHSLEVELIFEQPHRTMFKTSGSDRGKLSRRGCDLSNIEKMLIDLVFDLRFSKRGWDNLALDDTLIATLTSKKRKSPNSKSYITIIITEIRNTNLLP